MPVLVEKPDEAIAHLLENGSSERYRVNGSSISIKIKKGKRLTGEDDTFLEQVGDGSIIKLFDKTPFPEEETDVVCPHFLELKWANGCYFDCSWCYLNGTFRFQERGKNAFLKPTDKIESHLKSMFNQWVTPSILNSGELSDSLVFEGHPYSISKDIIPLFKNQCNHKLLLLTKSSNVKGILESDSQDVVISSFSINAHKVAQRWEKKAPRPSERLQAAGKLFDAGYQVRIRIDPMVSINKWKPKYLAIVDDIFENLYPERITLGTLRGLQSTINFCKDKTWVDYLESGRGSNWGKKIPDDIRLDMYSSIIDYLKDTYNYHKVSICKETVSMWKKLKLDYTKITCNCVL